MSTATSTSASHTAITTAEYGVPIRFSLDPDVEAEQPIIDAHQDRGDARVNVPIGGFFKLFEFRGGLSKYHHAELDPEGERRLTLLPERRRAARRPRPDRAQAAGAGRPASSISIERGRIRGDEKYLPDNRKRNLGLFTLQSVESGKVRFEGARAGRLHAAHRERRSGHCRSRRGSRRGQHRRHLADQPQLHAWSGSVGANYEIAARLARGAFGVAQRARARRSTSCSPSARTAAANSS